MAKAGLLLHKEADNRDSVTLISGCWTKGSMTRGHEGCRLIKATCSRYMLCASRRHWPGSITSTAVYEMAHAVRTILGVLHDWGLSTAAFGLSLGREDLVS